MTVYKALRELNIRPGQIVAISGAGDGLGALAIQYAKAMKLRVLAIDTKEKESHCRYLGTNFFVDSSNEDKVVKRVKKVSTPLLSSPSNLFHSSIPKVAHMEQ